MSGFKRLIFLTIISLIFVGFSLGFMINSSFSFSESVKENININLDRPLQMEFIKFLALSLYFLLLSILGVGFWLGNSLNLFLNLDFFTKKVLLNIFAMVFIVWFFRFLYLNFFKEWLKHETVE